MHNPKMSNQEHQGHCLAPPYSSATRRLNFRQSPAEASLVEGSKMLPIRRNSNFSSLRDDERDDSGSAAQPRFPSRWGTQHTDKHFHHPNTSAMESSVNRSLEFRQGYAPVPQVYPPWHQSSRWHSQGGVDPYQYQDRQPHRTIGMVPVSRDIQSGSMLSERYRPAYSSSEPERYRPSYHSVPSRVVLPQPENPRNHPHIAVTNAIPGPPKAAISKGLVLPRGLVSKPPEKEQSVRKRKAEASTPDEQAKKSKSAEPLAGKFDKLDLLCTATLELGPLQENPTGCSCPKSKCIALYCDCFKAGRRCSDSCTCLDCKNTVEESGPNGARSKVCHQTTQWIYSRTKSNLDFVLSRQYSLFSQGIQGHLPTQENPILKS